MSRKCWCVACAVLLGVVSFLGAQPPGMPQPSPEHAYLKKMAGTWDCTMKMMGQEGKAVANYKMLGDFWLIGDFEGDAGGMKFKGHDFMGYDPQKKKYIGTWVDSLSPNAMPMESTYDSSKKVMTAVGEGINMEGKKAKFKTTSEWKSNDEMLFTMYEEKDGKMEQSFTIDYKRRK
jgi:hypothetical protein